MKTKLKKAFTRLCNRMAVPRLLSNREIFVAGYAAGYRDGSFNQKRLDEQATEEQTTKPASTPPE